MSYHCRKSAIVTVLKVEIDIKVLMTELHCVTEEKNNVRNEDIEKVVAEFRRAVRSGNNELEILPKILV